MRIFFLIIGWCLSVTLTGAENRIWVDATINNQPVRLIVDTGASDPILFRGTAERLKLKITEPPPNLRPAPGEIIAGYTEPCDLVIQRTTAKEVFRIVDWPPEIQTQAEGALSWYPMRKKVFAFDAANQKLDVGDVLPEYAVGWPKFKLRTDARVLGFKLPNGQPQHDCIYIDTGSESGVQLHPALWQKWTATRANQPATLFGYYSPGPGIVVKKEMWARELPLGSLTLKDVPVQEEVASNTLTLMPDHAATLGLFALRRLDLVMDGSNAVVYARPRNDPPPMYPHNRLGAVFVPRDLQTEPLVARVLPRSPADLAGIRDGDVLLRIGDLDVTIWRAHPQVRPSSFWERPAGTTLELTLKRGEKEYRTKVTLKNLLGPGIATGF